jgi:putative transposase
MTDADHCYQNAIAERVNGILKDESNLDTVFRNFDVLPTAVARSIMVYNNKRTHWSLGLLTPIEMYELAA